MNIKNTKMALKLMLEFLVLSILSLSLSDIVGCAENYSNNEFGVLTNNSDTLEKNNFFSNGDVVIEFDENTERLEINFESGLFEKKNAELNTHFGDILTENPQRYEQIEDITIIGGEISDLIISDETNSQVEQGLESKIDVECSEKGKDYEMSTYVHGIRSVAPQSVTTTSEHFIPLEILQKPNSPTSEGPTIPTTLPSTIPAEQISVPEGGSNCNIYNQDNEDIESWDDKKEDKNDLYNEPVTKGKPDNNESGGFQGGGQENKLGGELPGSENNNVSTNARPEVGEKPDSGGINHENGNESNMGSESGTGGENNDNGTTEEELIEGTGTDTKTSTTQITSTTTINPGLIAGAVLGGIGGLAGLGVLAGLGTESRKRKKSLKAERNLGNGITRVGVKTSSSLRGSTCLEKVGLNPLSEFEMINNRPSLDVQPTLTPIFLPALQTMPSGTSGVNNGLMPISSGRDEDLISELILESVEMYKTPDS
ncbi:hypothetical protein FG386_001281 [Cryptosporidium ryanae]|uniref:uncharacterized protein n=1 Tax=Cryptosporidium ryanae TaxID=515981 RepID=UPI00351A226C|nr:hypothetical protein FG386_001281 [Cryptosporidium ryanae]